MRNGTELRRERLRQKRSKKLRRVIPICPLSQVVYICVADEVYRMKMAAQISTLHCENDLRVICEEKAVRAFQYAKNA